jgi:hypothetical protein
MGRAYLTSAYLLLLPLSASLLAVVGFRVGVPIGRLHLPIALALAGVATGVVAAGERLARRDVVVALCAGTAVLALAALAGHLVLDLSYDGQAYHASAIRQLASGWNPAARALEPADTIHGLWLNHYVRAVELGAATVAAATGSLEAGKALGLALIVAAALLGATALRCASVRRGPAAAVALIAAANPVTLAQAATFYVDGQLALVFASAVALAVCALAGRVRTAPWLLAGALALLANVKFTATVYAALLLAGYLVAALGSHRPRPPAVAPALLAVAAALVIGWQPLITNAVEHGHPFHPVAGPSRVDGLSGQTPWFRHADPLRRFVESTFSESNSRRVVPVAKLPFVVRRREIATMAVPDVRVGGFGPLFALAIAAGLIAAAWTFRDRRAWPWLAAAAGVLATALVNPGAWWARFVPQVWLAVVVLCAGAAVSARRAARAFGTAALAVLAADAAVVAGSVGRHQAATQTASMQQLRDLARSTPSVDVVRGEFETVDLRAARAGLRVRYVPACPDPELLVGTYAFYCPAAPAKPSAEPKSTSRCTKSRSRPRAPPHSPGCRALLQRRTSPRFVEAGEPRRAPPSARQKKRGHDLS